MQEGDTKDAVSEFRESIRLDPNNPRPHYNFGLALEKEGDRSGAKVEFNEFQLIKQTMKVNMQ